jgi:hypothetical protein
MPRRHRILTGVGLSLGLAVLALVVFLLLLVGRASSRIDSLNSDSQSRDRAIGALASAEAQARDQIKALGGTPNVPPPAVIISAIPGATGQQGPGPSDAQITSAVAAYLEAHPVPGVSGAQVAAGVASYLAASPAPSGPAGPGPSDQQIADAVAAYMSANPAPSGPAGRDGSNGADGSPPAGWSFEANGVTYNCVPDDGTPAPHYTCPPSAPSPSPTPTDSGSPSPSPSTSSASPSPSGAAPTAPATVPASFTVTPQTPSTPSPDTGRWLSLLLGVPFYRRGL